MHYLQKYNHCSDNKLITEYKQTNDNVLVGILYKRYSHLVLGLCLKYLKDEDDAKDAVMQIFEKLLTDLIKHNIEYFKSWLYVFSKNHCLMVIRKNQAILAKDADLKIKTHSFMETTTDFHLNSEQEKENGYVLLEKAISELNNEQKQCVELFYLQQKSYVNIVQITGYSLNEVKSFIQNGKRNLKIKLEKSK